MMCVTGRGELRHRPFAPQYKNLRIRICGVVSTENDDGWSTAVLKYSYVILPNKYLYIDLPGGKCRHIEA